jgi:hypothetical protein
MNSAHFANFALTGPPQLANLGNPASAIANEGVTGVVLNASTYLFFSSTSSVGVTNSGISSSSLDLSRSKPMQPHA